MSRKDQMSSHDKSSPDKSSDDNRIEVTIMGTLGAGVVLALAYTIWFSAAGPSTVGGDRLQATLSQQDTRLLTQDEPAAAPTDTDSTQGETAKPSAPASEPASSETSQAAPASEPASSETSQAAPASSETSQAAPASEPASSEPASSETSQAAPASVPEPLFIAGTTPWERPPAAPFLVPKPKDSSWYARALTGIAPPYPASLSFLEDQGAWYTPFNHPGMTAPYDIRHWHGQ